MNIFSLLFKLFLIYLAYKLIFDFIIPVYRTSKQVKQKMNEMHQKMEEQQRTSQQPSPKPREKREVAGDYIEYEEIK